MNRRGAQVDFIMKFVLSAIGIALVLVIVGNVLSKVLYDDAVAQAKQTLSSLMAKAGALKDGENNTFIVRGVSEENENWYLVGWNLEDGDARSDKCTLNNCICICRAPNKDGCDKKNGICRAVKDRRVSVRTALFDEWSDTKGLGPGARPVHNYYNSPCIPLKKNFMEISISKNKSILAFGYVRNEALDKDLNFGACGGMTPSLT